MSNFAESQRRLDDALARIDAALQRCAAQSDGPDYAAENRALRARLAALENAPAPEAPDAAPDAALAAEIEALKSARAAEVAALDDIILGLENLLAARPEGGAASPAQEG